MQQLSERGRPLAKAPLLYDIHDVCARISLGFSGAAGDGLELLQGSPAPDPIEQPVSNRVPVADGYLANSPPDLS